MVANRIISILFFISIICSTKNLHGHSDEEEDANDENDHHKNEDGYENETEEHHHVHNVDSLFVKYDSTASPTHGTGKPTQVAVGIYVDSLNSVSDIAMEFCVDSRLVIQWNDSRLISEKCKQGKECDDKFDIRLKLDKIWKPDIYFYKSKQVKFHNEPVPNVKVVLSATGQLLLSKRLTLTIGCHMNVRYFPLDTQSCSLLMCSYSLIEKELKLVWDRQSVETDFDPAAEHTQFEFIPPVITHNVRISYNAADVSGNFSCLNGTFIFRRQNTYHLVYCYMLTAFIVIVSWISFWLDVHTAPARITLGVTTLLTLTTTASNIRSNLPPVTYVTAIDVWIGICSMFVFTAFLEYPLALFFSKSDITQVNVIKTIKVKDVKDITKPSDTNKSYCCHWSSLNTLDKCCRIVYPIVFLIFNSLYWPYYLTASRWKG